MKHDLGMFECTSGKLCVIDPCYTKQNGIIVDNAKSGIWVASVKIEDVDGWGHRVMSLTAKHITYQDIIPDLDIDYVDVDSGQVGIFDNDFYPEDPRDEQNENAFYDVVCDLTLESKNRSGVVGDKGCVSSSGLGDGSYNVCAAVARNETVAIEITYIDYIDLDEEDDE